MRRSPVALALCCNTLLTSLYRHDFVRCKCGKSFVDGGPEYRRFGGEVKWLTKSDALKPEIAKMIPAFNKECRKKAEKTVAENWEYAQKLFHDHGIMTREFLEPKPKGARIPKLKKGQTKFGVLDAKGIYESDDNE